MTNMGTEALPEAVKRYAVGIITMLITRSVTQGCEICVKSNPKIQRPLCGQVKTGFTPVEYCKLTTHAPEHVTTDICTSGDRSTFQTILELYLFRANLEEC